MFGGGATTRFDRKVRIARDSQMLLDAVFFLVQAALDLFWWAVLLAAIVQTLMAFNVLWSRGVMT